MHFEHLLTPGQAVHDEVKCLAGLPVERMTYALLAPALVFPQTVRLLLIFRF